MDISTITSIALDLAGRYASFQSQAEISNITLYLLEKGYNILLFTSTEGGNLEKEYFEHPRLKFVSEVLSPDNLPTDDFPELASIQTFWVTDNPELHAWLAKHNQRFAYTSGAGTFGDLGTKIGSVADLAGFFNSTARLLQQITQAIHVRRQAKGKVPFLVGVSGPPMSGYQQLAVDLKRELEEIGYPLVDFLDLSSFLTDTESTGLDMSKGGAWVSSAARDWMLESLLGPLHSGSRVFVEDLPEAVPEAFGAHLPLFLAEESVVVLLGETLFQPKIRDLLDFAILLELSARETARRIYEIPPGQAFDDRFTNQYLEKQGRNYSTYLDTHQVKDTVSARVSAELPDQLSLRFLAELH